jgi:D-amino peptidase
MSCDDIKIYVSVDFEGGACLVGEPEQTLTASKQYEFARKVMTGEANAAARGAYDAGCSEVVIRDAHGAGLNLLYDELDERVKVVLGVPAPRRFPGLDGSFSGVFLIGYHPMAGAEGGVLSHTYSSKAVQNMWLNGRRIGEIGFDAALCGSLGVPVLMVSSCEAGVKEAHDFLGEIETVATKIGYSRNCAMSLTPSAGRQRIRSAAKRAVESVDGSEPYVVPGPYELKREFKYESQAARARPPFTRVDPRTIAGRSENLFDLI